MTGHSGLRSALGNVAVTTVSPFVPDGSDIDDRAVRSNAEWLVERGIQVLIPAGNTGEHHSLASEEWSRLVDATIEAVGASATVMPAVSGPVQVVARAASHAAARGAPGVLLLPLHNTYTSQEGTRRYYEAVLDAVDLGVVIYLRDGSPDPGVENLLEHPNLAGVKWAVSNVNQFANARRADPDNHVAWTCGIAESWAPMFYLSGAIGMTSGIGNFAPHIPLALHEAAMAGDWPTAMRLRNVASQFESLRARHGNANNVPAVKQAMEMCGLAAGPVRPPLSEVPSGELSDLGDAVRIIREEI